MLCEQIPELEIIKAFNDPEKLLAELPLLDFDLCISDIEMPGIDGLTLAGLLQDKLIIFTTAYKDYAADAFDADVVDYVIKPVGKERLQKAVDKALERFSKRPQTKERIQLNTNKGKAFIYFDKIAYIKTAAADSRDKELYLIDGSLLLLKNINFDSMLSLLPSTGFCRINKKELIAISELKFFSHNEIILRLEDKNGKNITLALSETYRSDFLNHVKT
jgi:DNA-binding LytR/AlgR family response regulator